MATVARFSPTSVQFGTQFDTSYKYLISGRAGADFPITYGGETFQLASTASPTVTNTQWRYSVNGYVKEYDPPSVLSANSSFVLVTTTS